MFNGANINILFEIIAKFCHKFWIALLPELPVVNTCAFDVLEVGESASCNVLGQQLLILRFPRTIVPPSSWWMTIRRWSTTCAFFISRDYQLITCVDADTALEEMRAAEPNLILSDVAISFFRTYKLNRAAELLKSGKYTVSEIADKCGFSSQSHFSTVFKKQFGISPSEYK